MKRVQTSETTRAQRLHIGLFGRCNAGKSTLCNALSGQHVALVSPLPGTTTDPVEKVMEMAPLGPVVLHDTAGLDDTSSLGRERVQRTLAELKSVDLALLVLEECEFGQAEETAIHTFEAERLPFAIVCSLRHPLLPGDHERMAKITEVLRTQKTFGGIAPVWLEDNAWQGLEEVRRLVAALAPRDREPAMLQDLLPERNGRLVLVCPQDSGAPRGRLIMPQVQAIRDALDGRALCLVVTDEQVNEALQVFDMAPDLVVCDSQVVRKVAACTPEQVPFTTFSILMARMKGDLESLATGAAALLDLHPKDTVIIQEACSHHAQKDDIGRVQIPRLLAKLAGGPVNCPVLAGRSWSEYDGTARAIVHCGACTLTRREMNARLAEARERGIPMTNYGMALSLGSGLLQRTLAPFPQALAAWQRARAHA